MINDNGEFVSGSMAEQLANIVKNSRHHLSLAMEGDIAVNEAADNVSETTTEILDTYLTDVAGSVVHLHSEPMSVAEVVSENATEPQVEILQQAGNTEAPAIPWIILVDKASVASKVTRRLNKMQESINSLIARMKPEPCKKLQQQ